MSDSFNMGYAAPTVDASTSRPFVVPEAWKAPGFNRLKLNAWNRGEYDAWVAAGKTDDLRVDMQNGKLLLPGESATPLPQVNLGSWDFAGRGAAAGFIKSEDVGYYESQPEQGGVGVGLRDTSYGSYDPGTDYAGKTQEQIRAIQGGTVWNRNARDLLSNSEFLGRNIYGAFYLLPNGKDVPVDQRTPDMFSWVPSKTRDQWANSEQYQKDKDLFYSSGGKVPSGLGMVPVNEDTYIYNTFYTRAQNNARPYGAGTKDSLLGQLGVMPAPDKMEAIQTYGERGGIGPAMFNYAVPVTVGLAGALFGGGVGSAAGAGAGAAAGGVASGAATGAGAGLGSSLASTWMKDGATAEDYWDAAWKGTATGAVTGGLLGSMSGATTNAAASTAAAPGTVSTGVQVSSEVANALQVLSEATPEALSAVSQAAPELMTAVADALPQIAEAAPHLADTVATVTTNVTDAVASGVSGSTLTEAGLGALEGTLSDAAASNLIATQGITGALNSGLVTPFQISTNLANGLAGEISSGLTSAGVPANVAQTIGNMAAGAAKDMAINAALSTAMGRPITEESLLRSAGGGATGALGQTATNALISELKPYIGDLSSQVLANALVKGGTGAISAAATGSDVLTGAGLSAATGATSPIIQAGVDALSPTLGQGVSNTLGAAANNTAGQVIRTGDVNPTGLAISAGSQAVSSGVRGLSDAVTSDTAATDSTVINSGGGGGMGYGDNLFGEGSESEAADIAWLNTINPGGGGGGLPSFFPDPAEIDGANAGNGAVTTAYDASSGLDSSSWSGLLSKLTDPKVIAALATAGLTIGGSIAGNNTSNNAANANAAAQIAANNAALAELKRQYDQNRTDFAPYLDLGTTAAGTLKSTLPTADKLKTPTYGTQMRPQGLAATQLPQQAATAAAPVTAQPDAQAPQVPQMNAATFLKQLGLGA